ncbi:MAG: hypothetical protein HY730_00130, partial [Candidatus Tectomicrobia bacterium]|nr:hypothetical protein [Candidatus Tectomicrobia bacterium]
LIDPRCVTANGEKFLVGDDAEREGSGLLETRTSDFVTSNAVCSAPHNGLEFD